MLRRVLATGALAVVVVLGAAAPAFADTLTIRKIDTTAYPTVKVSAIATGAKPDLGTFQLRESGQFVKDLKVDPILQTPTPVGIVLAIDTSASMGEGNRIDQARVAAKKFVADKAPNQQIALVSFNSQIDMVSGFTDDAGSLNAAIDKLAVAGDRSLWDAVRYSVDLYRDHPDLQRNLVIVTDGRDTASKADAVKAQAAAVDGHTPVFVVGLSGKDLEQQALQDLAKASGGQYVASNSAGDLVGMAGRVGQSLQNQYEISYTSAAKTQTFDIDLSVGGLSSSAKGLSPNTVSQGNQFRPEVVGPSHVPSFLAGAMGKWIVVLLVLAAAALLAYGLIAVIVREPSDMAIALRPYSPEAKIAERDDDENRSRSLATTGVIKRAVEMTGRMAAKRGLLIRVEEALERGNLPLRPAEALFFWLASAVIVPMLGLFLARGPGFVGGFVLAVLLPPAVVNYLAGRRRRLFTSLLPDMLQLVAGSLRAGYSLLQGVEAVSQEVSEPMASELKRVLAEARLGRPLEQALEECGARMSSKDFEWAVMAIRIQREVGGNLAELLSTVSETMISRERLRREVRALTAEGRMSAIVLGLLPAGLGVVMYMVNPGYMSVLFHNSLGKMMFIGSIILAVFGFWWMKKTIEVEV
jgi:tight adherence protein B